MIYSGNFSSFGSLQTSVETALQTEGWTLDSGILSKSGVFVRLTANATSLTLEGGTGQAAATLNGAAAFGVKIMDYTAAPMNFPATYDLHIHDNPDEVYLVVNYNADRYQQLSFGKSDVEQIGGTGAWFTGTFRSDANAAAASRLIYINTYGNGIGTLGGDMGLGLFFESYQASGEAFRRTCTPDSTRPTGAPRLRTTAASSARLTKWPGCCTRCRRSSTRTPFCFRSTSPSAACRRARRLSRACGMRVYAASTTILREKL